MARTVWRESPETVEVCDQSAFDSHELHVLAVDDSLVDRKVIERLLKISSCKVTAVESGSRALQYLGLDGEKSSIGFEDLKVNLIMTDYSMPGMTGYELLKKIKTSSTLRKIPVVIMSSENILTRIDRCLEEGAEDFLVKPVQLSDVKRLKDFILRGEGEENGEKGSPKRRIQYSPLSASQPLTPSPHCHRKDFKMRGGEGDENGERGTHKRELKDDPLSPFLSPSPSSSQTTLKFHSKRPRL